MAGPGFAETTNVTTGTSNIAVTNGQVAQSGKPRKEVDPVDQFPGERPAKDGRAGVKMLSKCAATDGLQAVCFGQVAQSVEQGTENPCVGGSIPPLATLKSRYYGCSRAYRSPSWCTHGALRRKNPPYSTN